MALEKFINLFNNGLNSDYNIVLQPDGTYRYMKNCNLISQDGNNYVIKDCLGNQRVININTRYDETYPDLDLAPMPICFISFPDKLIVLSTNSETTTGYGEIGMVKFTDYGQGIQPIIVSGNQNDGYVPLYHSASLNFTKLHRAQGFAYSENELIERIYWTDNFNEPRVFNVSDPIFTTYILSGSLVSGTDYMVLEGAIEHPVASGTFYGPGLTAGNVFTASAATYTATSGVSPTPKVIEYYPYQLLNFQPSRALGGITFDEFGAGNLFCGSKMYFYRLVKEGGVQTSWSYGSSPIPVGTGNVADYNTGISYHDYVGGGTVDIPLNSGLSVFINIDNIDQAFDYIEVACAEFDQVINTPRLISIIAREAITATTMNIEHDGSVNLGTLTIGDVTLFPASILTCKTITTNKNYILIANTTEREEFDFDTSGINVGVLKYPMNCHMDLDSCSLSGMIPDGVSPTSGANPGAGTITPYSRWLVIDVAGGSVEYPVASGTFYGLGSVIVGVVGSTSMTIPGASQVRPCHTRNRYTVGGARNENAIEIKNDGGGAADADTCFWDYKSAVAHHHVAGYWSGETYRFGILFFDLKGNPFYVKWIADFTVPGAEFSSGIIREDAFGADVVYSLNPNLINFQNISIPQAIGDQISGWSIVRAERIPRIVTQGLVMQCSVNTTPTPDEYFPIAWIPGSEDRYTALPEVYSYLCPDILVNCPLKAEVGVIGDTLEEARWLEPYEYQAGVYVRGSDFQGAQAGSEQVYSKILTPLADDGIATRTGTIEYWNNIDEDEVIGGFTGGIIFRNTMGIGAAVTATVDGACVDGAADYTLDGHLAVGCKKVVVQLDNDFRHYNSANGYGSVAANALPEKILMNYVKSGAPVNPYGNTEDTLYISTGHFQPMTADVKFQVLSGGNYVFTDVEIAGGDCYTCLVDLGYGLWNDGAGTEYSYALTFPCECNANYNLRRGRKTSNVGMFYTGIPLPTDSIVYSYAGPPVISQLEDFSYNEGYSSETLMVRYPALPQNFINANEFQSRIRYAGQKIIGEAIDTFRTFGVFDYKDISVQNGRINDLETVNDTVIVFQDWAVNTVPILERQVISSIAGLDTAIGTGGVVDRWDVISSVYGCQHQWSVCHTKYGLTWFDMQKKAILIMGGGGGQPMEVSQILGIKGELGEAFLEVEGRDILDENKILNSQVLSETSDRPLMGVGIISVYDPKLDMAYMTFKFFGQKTVSAVAGYKSKDFTVGYLITDLKKCIVGYFDWFPAIVHNHNQWIFSANNPKTTSVYLISTYGGQSFVPGDTLKGLTNNTEYICYTAVTLDAPAKYPQGASGATYWLAINSTDQLWVNNQPTDLAQLAAPGYQYNKWFDRVVDNVLWPVVNPGKGQIGSFEVLNMEQNGPYNVNYTTIAIEADNQSAEDTSIAGTNTNYRFIRDKITSNMPLSTTGRIVNSYLLIKLTKKNWTAFPNVLTGSVKILRAITTYFAGKR